MIAHSVDEVWAFFGRVEDVAECLPGASLDGGEKDGVVNGKMKVKVGPISAEFSGVAQITRDETAHRGAIVGSGRDARSNSSTRGVVAYSIKPNEDGVGSRVDVDVGYTLTGMLAQFGRSGLVQDIASRLTAAFARNLEARLSAGSDPRRGASCCSRTECRFANECGAARPCEERVEKALRRALTHGTANSKARRR